nr:radical SAM protein [Clostridioides difficile]
MQGTINLVKDEAFAEDSLRLGINRVSFGIKIFNKNIHKKMNMRTKIEYIYRSVEILKKVGLTYCINVMYNLPNQKLEDLYDDLEKVTAFDSPHIYIFNTILFRNTYLDKMIKTKNYFKINPLNKNQLNIYKKGHQ